MAHVRLDAVGQIATGTGNSTLTLGAVTDAKHRTLTAAGMVAADTTYARIQHETIAAEWEISKITLGSGTITRTFDSNCRSATGNLISFSAGNKIITATVDPASVAVSMDPNGDAFVKRNFVAQALAAQVAGSGYASVSPGGPVNSGYTAFFKADGSRVGYVGWGIDQISYVAELAGSFHCYYGPGSVEWGRLSSQSFRVHGGSSKYLLLQHAGTDAYIRPDNVGAELYLGAGVTNVMKVNANAVLPVGDNTTPFGGAGNRWSVVYAGTGTINTSGRDAKLLISEASDAEKRAAARIRSLVRKYKMADAVETKGEASARWHWGYVAEDVANALEAEGLDPWSYGFMCADPIIEHEIYTVTATRPKTIDVEATEQKVEIVDGQPVLKTVTVTGQRTVGAMLDVKNESGETVMVDTGRKDDEGNPVLAPMQHFVPEMEEYQEARTREVDSGQKRLGLRYSELEAFLRSAD